MPVTHKAWRYAEPTVSSERVRARVCARRVRLDNVRLYY